MNVLSIKEKARIVRALVEGCSIRSTERMTGHHRDTIIRVMLEAGKKAEMGCPPIRVEKCRTSWNNSETGCMSNGFRRIRPI